MTALAVAKARKPDVPRAALFRSGGTAAWIAAARDLACIAVHVRRDRLTARRVLKLKAAGFACGTYTINRETTARRFLGFGVAYVFSDRPAEILAGLSR